MGKYILADNQELTQFALESLLCHHDETLAVKEEFLNRNESLKSMYKADDDNMAVLYIRSTD